MQDPFQQVVPAVVQESFQSGSGFIDILLTCIYYRLPESTLEGGV